MSLWAHPTRFFHVWVTLLTNHQQIRVLTCAQTTWSLTEIFPDSVDHNPRWLEYNFEASEFLCNKRPLFRRSWASKKLAKKIRKCFLQCAANVTLSEFLGWRCRKTNRAGFQKNGGPQIFEYVECWQHLNPPSTRQKPESSPPNLH